MLGLVSAEKTGGLDLGGGSSREFLVEADNALHAEGIGGSADCLVFIRQPPIIPTVL